jgi:hypothetical protein
MYSAIKTNAINEAAAREEFGDTAVDYLLTINCDFTNRVIGRCYGVTEMSASIEAPDKSGEERTLEVLYLVDSDSLADCDDLGSLDYSDYTFVLD